MKTHFISCCLIAFLCLSPPCSCIFSEGSNLTPAHHYSDFRFKTYAPIAFRYFRELFGIRPDDYLVSTHTTVIFSYCPHNHAVIWCSAVALVFLTGYVKTVVSVSEK